MQIAKGAFTRAQVANWGRTGGYEVVYRRKDGPPGVNVVVSDVDVFKTRNGTRQALRGLRKLLFRAPWRSMPTQGPVGEEGYAFTTTVRERDGSRSTVALGVWRYRNVIGSVVISSPVGMIDPMWVNAVSRTQQELMERVFVLG